MRLLNTQTLKLEEFFTGSGAHDFANPQVIDQRLQNQRIPKYAILSHTCELAKVYSYFSVSKRFRKNS